MPGSPDRQRRPPPSGGGAPALALRSNQRGGAGQRGPALVRHRHRILAERLGPERLRFHPAPTCLQLRSPFKQRIGRPWQDARWVSLHGRDPEPLARELQTRPRALAVLTDPSPGSVAVPTPCAAVCAAAVWRRAISSGWGKTLVRADERMRLIPADAPLPEPLQPLLVALLIAEEPSIPNERAFTTADCSVLEDGLYLQHPDHPGR